MDGAARLIAGELRQVQRFGYDALSGKSGVTVQKHWDHAGAPGVAQVILLGADDPFHHRIHGFEMTRVRRH